MSFPFREIPNLGELLRGKSGADMIKELRQELKQNRKRFFENSNWGTSPAGSTFSRRRFPFDDEEDEVFSRQSPDWQAHLDEIADRHPEFADQVRDWLSTGTSRPREYESQTKEPPKKEERNQCSEEGRGAAAATAAEGCCEPPLGGSKLSATVPDMQHQHDDVTSAPEDRGHRAKSAPPPSPQQAQMSSSSSSEHQHPPYVSRVDVNQQPSPNEEAPQQHSKQPTVRHIPIYVEGRDEPILPKEAVEQRATASSTRHNASSASSQPPPAPHHQQKPRKVAEQSLPKQRSMESPAPSAEVPKPSPPSQQHPVPPQHHQPPIPLSQIAKVQAVQDEVKALKQRVDEFGGDSKADKEYIYLDEMLTRNLLKLDDIETEGKEEVRAARKEVIRSIQKCISILDSKAGKQPEKTDVMIPETKEETPIPENDTTQKPEEGSTEANAEGNQENSTNTSDPPPPPEPEAENSKDNKADGTAAAPS